MTYLLTFTGPPAFAAAAVVPGSKDVPGGPVSKRIGRVDLSVGFCAYRSIDWPSCGSPGWAPAICRMVEVMSPFQTSALGCEPAGMPGPRISSGTWVEGS